MAANDDDVLWGDDPSIHRTTLADGTDMVFRKPKFPAVVEGIAMAGEALYLTEGGFGGLGVAKDLSSVRDLLVAGGSLWLRLRRWRNADEGTRLAQRARAW